MFTIEGIKFWKLHHYKIKCASTVISSAVIYIVYFYHRLLCRMSVQLHTHNIFDEWGMLEAGSYIQCSPTQVNLRFFVSDPKKIYTGISWPKAGTDQGIYMKRGKNIYRQNLWDLRGTISEKLKQILPPSHFRSSGWVRHGF